MNIPNNDFLSETVKTCFFSLSYTFRERSSATQDWAAVVVVNLSGSGPNNVPKGLNLVLFSALIALGSL